MTSEARLLRGMRTRDSFPRSLRILSERERWVTLWPAVDREGQFSEIASGVRPPSTLPSIRLSFHRDLYNVRDCFRNGRAREREGAPSRPPNFLASRRLRHCRFSSPPSLACSFQLASPRLASHLLSSPPFIFARVVFSEPPSNDEGGRGRRNLDDLPRVSRPRPPPAAPGTS